MKQSRETLAVPRCRDCFPTASNDHESIMQRALLITFIPRETNFPSCKMARKDRAFLSSPGQNIVSGMIN
jgi:hypothetical protein